MRRAIFVASFAAVVTIAIVAARLSKAPIDPGPSPVAVKRVAGRPERLREKVLVINIWGTWCAPHVAELPLLEKRIQDRYEGRVIVLAISPGETEQQLYSFRDAHKTNLALVAKSADPDEILLAMLFYNLL
jgi:thiol-disulfide isomerase/thioredoxin